VPYDYRCRVAVALRHRDARLDLGIGASDAAREIDLDPRPVGAVAESEGATWRLLSTTTSQRRERRQATWRACLARRVGTH